MLRASDLAAPRLSEAKENHQTYKLILNQCYEVIKSHNNRRLFQACFAVPSKVVGRPQFKHEHAISYVDAKLQRGMFAVSRVPPTRNVLLVVWGHARSATLSGKQSQKNVVARV